MYTICSCAVIAVCTFDTCMWMSLFKNRLCLVSGRLADTMLASSLPFLVLLLFRTVVTAGSAGLTQV